MKMVAGLVVVLVTAFALPSAFASFETKDFITRGAYENLVKSGAIEGITMTKTIISNPILEEALVAYSNHKLGGGTIFDCGETCFLGTCYTGGCSCGQFKFCYGTNSLEQNSNKAGEVASFETKDFITRGAYENLVKSGAIEGITMTKTIVSNPILEEALVAYSNHKLGGGTIFDCGETCFLGTCYTGGCSCGQFKFCYGTNSLEQNSNKAGEVASFETKDFITRGAYENLVKSGAIEGITMTKTIISNPILEEALVAYSNHKLGGGTIFDCGETCFLGTCYTGGCSCGQYKFCYGTNSLEKNSNKAGEEALVDFARKGLAAALAGLAN